MKRIGIYGGSFSPPHNGHVKSALAFYDFLTPDELRVMPAGVPPHKVLQGDASPLDRMNMTKIAFAKAAGDRKIIVDDWEIRKEGRSYTFETLEHFASPDTELCLLVGSDMFLSLDSWMKPEVICALATIVVNRRENDYESSLFDEKKEKLEKNYGARVIIPPYHPLVTSSSDVRSLLSRGQNNYELRRALDTDVLDYIIEKDLYGYTSASLENIRARLPEFVSDRRTAHILSVEKEVTSIARLIGMSEKETFILRKAALLHDLTHEKTTEEQEKIYALFKKTPSEEDLKSPAVMHQFTGALLAERLFDLEDEGCRAIACHTTGKPGMNTAEMVLCLADFIEKTREYPACKELRRYFYAKAQTGRVGDSLLRDCMKRYLTCTVDHLREKGAFIHPLTLEALGFYEQY